MTVTLDHETVELLAADAELLALADAVAAAGAGDRRRRRMSRRLLVAIAAAVSLVGLALVAPWDHGRATLVERARAAIGNAPVLHAVTRETLDSGRTLVNLRTGKRTPVDYVQEHEIWFDVAAKRAHTITRTNGVVSDDVLETSEGGVSMDGPVITCAWIARHPAEATKRRVSCRFDGDNSKMAPIDFPDLPPAVDPALGDFITHYRDALGGDRTTNAGEGEIDGRPVQWLSIPTKTSIDPTAPPSPPVEQRELVAVDRETYRPVLVRTVVDGAVARSYRVLEIETVSREDADFTAPERRPAREQVTIGEGTGKTPVDAQAAERVLGRQPLWLGSEFNGLKLSSIERQGVITGYARATGLPHRTDSAIVLTYSDREGARQIRLVEATRPLFAFGWFQGPLGMVPFDLPAGTVLLGGFGGHVIQGGIYVAIQAPGYGDVAVAAARALRQM